MIKLINIFLNYFGFSFTKNALPASYYKGASTDPQYNFHPTPIANYYLPKHSKSDDIAAHMKRGVYFESEVIQLAEQYIKKGSCVLDIGANYGQMSVAFCKLTGAEGKVYSFEAQKAVYDVLVKNLEANNCTWAVPHLNAVYNQSGIELVFPEPDFTHNQTYGSFGLNPKATAGQKVKSITIDSLQIDTPISFMKVDIQGADLFALQGAKQTILKHKMPILFEFEQDFQEQFETSFQQYVEFVNEIGYRFEKTLLGINYLILPK